MSLPYKQRIEVGPWFEVGKRIHGSTAQARLVNDFEFESGERSPYCIYIHVPFCTSRCSYCALYTRAVIENQKEIFDEYLCNVKQSITTHPNKKQAQPPTTVHFGGGTPLTIGLNRFEVLTTALRGAFGDSSECEWAIETTTSSIDLDTINTLKSLGINRIHLGIQTLNNAIRNQIKRRETGEKVIQIIEQLHSHGFLTSADLIIGFENQTDFIVKNDLERLYSAGIRMFSICELRNLNINRDNAFQRLMLANNYNYWKLIWQFMDVHELHPIHIGQFGRMYEDNFYFTHPTRGEDCIAIGPYAHGTSGRMYYSNKLLPDYYNAINKNESPIDFAVIYSNDIQKIRHLECELLAHRTCQTTLDDLITWYQNDFEIILDFWVKHKLLVPATEKDSFCLSREGSWFVGNMISQVRQLVQSKAVKSNSFC